MAEEPDLIAQIDQAIAGGTSLAQLLYGVFAAFLEQGFERPEALTLTRDYYRFNLGPESDA